MKATRIWIAAAVVLIGFAVLIPCLRAGETGSASSYKVLAPIHHGSLTIFPVVSAVSHDTSQFLTLDEGLRSGEVLITESGTVSPLVRPRHQRPVWQEHPGGGAQVNQLVLVNNSKRPLLLLAGEVVTGGKQDRIIGKDLLVPAESDPVDLGVFCVEPGRWVGASAKFSVPAVNGGGAVGGFVQPSIRARAMADKDQRKVWDEVGKARAGAAETVTVEAEAMQVEQTSSYAGVMQNRAVKEKIEEAAKPIEQDYRSVIGQLRDQNAVGVVVAVNGEIIWADVFASPRLLEKYWPKLVRSYAAESVVQQAKAESVSLKSAQEFLDRVQGRREVVENEPGLYRHTEISGDGFKVFELASLLPGTGFDLHVAKMRE